jgi:hypothetical protein
MWRKRICRPLGNNAIRFLQTNLPAQFIWATAKLGSRLEFSGDELGSTVAERPVFVGILRD